MSHHTLRALIDQIGVLVFLAGAIGVALVTMAFDEPPELVSGDWQEGRPWHWPEQPLAPLKVGLMICTMKVTGSPERVC
jgi:hypothetical protein